MRRRLCMGVLVLFGVGIGCASSEKKATSGGAVLETVSGDDDAHLKKDAPEAYEKAAKYAALAKEKGDAGDLAAKERYETLSRYQLRLARLTHEKKLLKGTIEQTAKTQRQILTDIENTKIALAALVEEAEREAIRRHLTEVVDETRRRAAAEETRRELLMTGEDKTAIRRARSVVAQEMISRARMWVDVAMFLSADKTNDAAAVPTIQAFVDAAAAEIDHPDLAVVQENLEKAGADGRRLVQTAWHGNEVERQRVIRETMAELVSNGFEVTSDEFGVVLSITADVESAVQAAQRLSEWLKTRPALRVLVVAKVSGGHAAAEKSEAIAEAWAQKLLDFGVPGQVVRHRGAGDRTPFGVMKQNATSVALLFVPVPYSK